MVLRTLAYLPFKHLTRLPARKGLLNEIMAENDEDRMRNATDKKKLS
jgi:hypothetical protein